MKWLYLTSSVFKPILPSFIIHASVNPIRFSHTFIYHQALIYIRELILSKEVLRLSGLIYTENGLFFEAARGFVWYLICIKNWSFDWTLVGAIELSGGCPREADARSSAFCVFYPVFFRSIIIGLYNVSFSGIDQCLS